MKIEKEWRQTLQGDLDREHEAVSQLSTEAKQIIGLRKVDGSPKGTAADTQHSNPKTHTTCVCPSGMCSFLPYGCGILCAVLFTRVGDVGEPA